jgi:S1-C subfamily serine protease
VINLSPAAAEELRVDANLRGVAIADVDEGTPAQVVGFRAGDVILEVNGEKVVDTRELERLTQARQSVWRLQILRGGQVITTMLGG